MKRILALAFLAASVLSCSDKGSEDTADYSLDLSVAQLQAEAEGGRFPVTVKATCDWKAACAAEWITLSPKEGEAGESTLSVAVEPNTATESRTAEITVNNDTYGVYRKITVNQKGDNRPVNPNDINIPDTKFKAYLIENFDTDGDGAISEAEAKAVGKIEIGDNDIASLQGIEYFTSLDTLDCNHNSLTSLDISRNKALKYLKLTSNSLSSLDLSNNTALTHLYCSSNSLTALDLSKNTVLQVLDCCANQLTSINVSNNTALTYLVFDHNQIAGDIDVSMCSKLSVLYCYDNQITTVNVTGCTVLKHFDCSNNQLTSLDVDECAALFNFSCKNNRIASLDLSNNTALTQADCTENPLTHLYLKKGQTIRYLNYPEAAQIMYK